MAERTYIAIDLKSFYASVECVERGLDPLSTNLVVADASRTEKTICLAVSPSLKACGISGRARLFEVIERVNAVNAKRKLNAPNRTFTGESADVLKLRQSPSLALSYIIAPPRMAHYMKYSTQIYRIYLKYVAPEDIHAYSIDEVFIDATAYLNTYCKTAREFAMSMIRDVLSATGITATAGIGTNLYLCKIAMDIVAKHVEPDENGVRIAELDEMNYRRLLWDHRPITDFWRVGPGYAKKLEEHGIYTMGDIARCSVGAKNRYYSEDLLYRLFGVNAELLIDHAWGWEPCTMAEIKAYKPESNSIGLGQVLQRPYDFEQARLVVREMSDALALELVDKGLVTCQLVLTVGYDVENLSGGKRNYKGEVTTDRYGRKIPKHARSTANIERYTSSARLITAAAAELFDRITDKKLLVRRLNLAACRVVEENEALQAESREQLNLFEDYDALQSQRKLEQADLDKEREMQNAILAIKKKYGKNALIKGMDLQEGATAVKRNSLIGGHQA